MKRRRLVVVLGFILMLAAAGVLLYSRGVDEEPLYLKPMAAVVVPEVDIPAGTDLDQLIRGGQFRLIMVPLDVVDDGTITSVAQLTHRRTRVAILAGEPIPAVWLKTRAERASS